MPVQWSISPVMARLLRGVAWLTISKGKVNIELADQVAQSYFVESTGQGTVPVRYRKLNGSLVDKNRSAEPEPFHFEM